MSAYVADVDVRTSILDLCRQHLGPMGAKKGCNHGQCGACTVLINGRRVNSRGCDQLGIEQLTPRRERADLVDDDIERLIGAKADAESFT